jgi:pimeloyl-ACP methyl ester carboxylesterase
MDAFFPRGLRVEIVPGTGHFLHQEDPERVNALILDFLRG